MKKVIYILTTLFTIFLLVGCSNVVEEFSISIKNKEIEVKINEEIQNKILIDKEMLKNVNFEIKVEDENIIQASIKDDVVSVKGLKQGQTNVLITEKNSNSKINFKAFVREDVKEKIFKLNLLVNVPSDTKGDLYLTGDFNNNKLDDKNYQLQKYNDKYRIIKNIVVKTNSDTYELKYKVVNNNELEKDKDNKDIEQRSLILKTTQLQPVVINVVKFKNSSTLPDPITPTEQKTKIKFEVTTNVELENLYLVGSLNGWLEGLKKDPLSWKFTKEGSKYILEKEIEMPDNKKIEYKFLSGLGYEYEEKDQADNHQYTLNEENNIITHNISGFKALPGNETAYTIQFVVQTSVSIPEGKVLYVVGGFNDWKMLKLTKNNDKFQTDVLNYNALSNSFEYLIGLDNETSPSTSTLIKGKISQNHNIDDNIVYTMDSNTKNIVINLNILEFKGIQNTPVEKTYNKEFVVSSFPENTNTDLYIVGDMNNWGRDNLSNYKLTLSDNKYSITLDIKSSSKTLEYKYLLARDITLEYNELMKHTEVNSQGKQIPNRVIDLQSSDKISDTIEKWQLVYRKVELISDVELENKVLYVLDGQDIKVLPVLENVGQKEFQGWYLEDTFTNKYTNQVVENDLKLYSSFKEFVQVTLNYNDTTTENSIEKIEKNMTFAKPTNPSRENYTFIKWYLSTDNTKKEYIFETPVTQNIELVANWQINKYDVTFNTGIENITIPTQTIAHGGVVVKPSDIQREGYTFRGWFLDNSLYNFETTVTKQIELVAGWDIITYDITFNTNDTNLTIPNQTVEHGSVVVEPEKLQKEGYTFIEWQLEGSLYDFNTKVSKSIELTALWQINSYEVTFNSGDNTRVENINHGLNVSKPISPIKEGHRFVEWQLDGKVFDFENTPITKSIELIAVFMETPTITFVENGGTKISPITRDKESVVVLPDPIKSNYRFLGWYLENNFTTKVAKNYTLQTNITLYANYIQQLTLTFNVDGGVEISPIVADKGSIVELPVAVKEAHRFDGWYLENSFTNIAASPYTLNTSITLYAKLTSSLDVVLNYNDQVRENKVVKIDNNTVFQKPTDPERIGYTFRHWALSTDNANTQYDFSKTVSTNIELVAQWQIKQYSVTFDYNDATTANRVETINHGDLVAKPVDPQSSGYRFVEWQINNVGYDFNTQITQPITLTAKWVIEITIQFDTNGGNIIENVVGDQNTTITLQTPVKEGNRFDGWFEKDDFSGTAFTGEYTLINSLILYAKFTKAVKVSLNYNDGVSENTSVQIDENTAYTKPQNPERVGYTFVKWYLSTDNSKAEYVFTTLVTNDIELVAEWKINTYTVTFNNGVDTTTIAQQNIDHGNRATKPTPTPTRLGYRFVEWQLNETAYDFSSEVVQSITLVAVWVETATITFDVDNGVEILPITNDKGKIITLEDAQKSGYRFLGWYLENSFENKVDKNYTLQTSTTLYASFIQQVSISFTLTSSTTLPTQTVDINSTIELPQPTLLNNRFDGWYEQSDFTSQKLQGQYLATKTVQLYAKWVLQVTISFDVDNGDAISDRVVDENENIVLVDAQKQDNIFDGWYTDSLKTNRVVLQQGRYVASSTTTLYAKFYSINDKSARFTINFSQAPQNNVYLVISENDFDENNVDISNIFKLNIVNNTATQDVDFTTTNTQIAYFIAQSPLDIGEVVYKSETSNKNDLIANMFNKQTATSSHINLVHRLQHDRQVVDVVSFGNEYLKSYTYDFTYNLTTNSNISNELYLVSSLDEFKMENGRKLEFVSTDTTTNTNLYRLNIADLSTNLIDIEYKIVNGKTWDYSYDGDNDKFSLDKDNLQPSISYTLTKEFKNKSYVISITIDDNKGFDRLSRDIILVGNFNNRDFNIEDRLVFTKESATKYTLKLVVSKLTLFNSTTNLQMKFALQFNPDTEQWYNLQAKSNNQVWNNYSVDITNPTLTNGEIVINVSNIDSFGN